MENLNKENFWNDVYAKYPNATQEFCNWIDNYKEQNGWNKLFGSDVKFHHIPVAMQLGIWFEFSFQQGCGNFTIELTADFDFAEDVRMWLDHREQVIMIYERG